MRNCEYYDKCKPRKKKENGAQKCVELWIDMLSVRKSWGYTRKRKLPGFCH